MSYSLEQAAYEARLDAQLADLRSRRVCRPVPKAWGLEGPPRPTYAKGQKGLVRIKNTETWIVPLTPAATTTTTERRDWSQAERKAIWITQGKMCGICGERTPEPGSIDWVHNQMQVHYPVIDHVVPLSLGGADTIRNVQIAHWGCNSRKSNSTLDNEVHS